MLSFYNINQFTLGLVTLSGHEVFVNARFKPSAAGGKGKRIILKKNKFGSETTSRRELAYTHLTQLFMGPGLTSDMRLVLKSHYKIWGLASSHMCYVIEDKEGTDARYYQLPDQDSTEVEMIEKSSAEDIPIYFFNKLPHCYFNKLLESGYEIDYASLAQIFTTSYFLEEDDLHKGNFGFYIVEKDNKPCVRFFKIDHDLMFMDSIMSQTSMRFFHWDKNQHAFDITARDLINFPYLRDSKNAYWPTHKSLLKLPFQNKHYREQQEVNAFINLGTNPEFKKAKWLAMYKQILMPVESIKARLSECFDVDDAYERAQIALILHATITRQARLRSVLFSINEFREFVQELPQESTSALVDELAGHDEIVRESITEKMQNYANNEYGFADGDNPLHIAIKLGEYRYDESMSMFQKYINEANEAGLRPIDIAVEKARLQTRPAKEVGGDARFIIKDLLKNNAQTTQLFDAFTEDVIYYHFQTPYMDRAMQVETYEDLERLLTEIGEDHQYSLKTKKNMALSCISACIKANPKDLSSILVLLKEQVNESAENAGGLAYIRQLRSGLWIIRQIRGLYGLSSTLWEINGMIDKTLNGLENYDFHCPSF